MKRECWYSKVCADSKPGCDRLCLRYTEMNYLMTHSNLPDYMQSAISLRVPKVDKDAYMDLTYLKSNIKDFVNDGKNLYIGSSTTGNGKTAWSVKLMHKYFDEVWAGNGLKERALFIPVAQFIVQNKDFRRVDENFNRIREIIYDIDLVVWDDIGSADLSAYDYSSILSILDYRTNSGKSNIYTSNHESEESIAQKVGSKIASRIFSKKTTVIIFKNGDMR